jgi:hypothetical protein
MRQVLFKEEIQRLRLEGWVEVTSKAGENCLVVVVKGVCWGQGEKMEPWSSLALLPHRLILLRILLWFYLTFMTATNVEQPRAQFLDLSVSALTHSFHGVFQTHGFKYHLFVLIRLISSLYARLVH